MFLNVGNQLPFFSNSKQKPDLKQMPLSQGKCINDGTNERRNEQTKEGTKAQMPGPHKGYLALSHHQASLSGSLEDGGQGSSPSGPSGRQDHRSSERRRGVTWPGPQSHASAVLASDFGETRAPSPPIRGPPQPARSSWKRGCPPGP